MRRTKIVCTLGPASSSPEILEEMALAGMNVARLSCSHGTWDEKTVWIRQLREIARKLATPIGIMIDLSGPKFRLGEVEGETLAVDVGQELRLTLVDGPIEFPLSEVHEAAQIGDRILIGDGQVGLEVTAKDDRSLTARVVDAGTIGTRQGVTLIGRDIAIAAVTPQDVYDLHRAMEEGVDWIAVSFIRTAKDIQTVKDMIAKAGQKTAVMAKIETPSAIDNLDEIIEASDGVMVARGDLGLQAPFEDVPHLQKRIIRGCLQRAKPAITATQMLESMIENDRPTRAEVTDVANAILDGSDAVMLSGETAIGKHPALVVRTMAKIAVRSEQEHIMGEGVSIDDELTLTDTTAAVGQSAVKLAQTLGVDAILSFTRSGATARMVSRFRPSIPIVAVCPTAETFGKLTVSWGVQPVLARPYETIDDMIDTAYTSALDAGYLTRGNRVVITAGIAPLSTGRTNLILFGEVSDPREKK